MSDSVRPHRRQPTRLLSPWDSPGKNTGVGCHFLLQCWKVKVKSLSRVQLVAIPWTAAHQALLSMGFSRQEGWSGVPLPSLQSTSSSPKYLTMEVTYRHHLNQMITVNIIRNRTFQNCMSPERKQEEEHNITSVASLPEMHNLIYSREYQKNLRPFYTMTG